MYNLKDIELSRIRLKRIHSIWDRYILNYKICQNHINFNKDVKTNFLAEVFSFFNETFDLIVENYSPKKSRNNFPSSIILLQSIYIQQDFIEELLIVFKTKKVKGDLKLDNNYQLNRDIRNELVGHPLRFSKEEGGRHLVSTTLFHYNISGKDKISYLRYHKDKSFKQELLSYSKEEILNRHLIFLNTYFDLILNVLFKSIKIYSRHLSQILNVVRKIEFEKLLTLTHNTYEFFFKSIRFNQIQLLEIYSRRFEHIRYQNYINQFYDNIVVCLNEDINEIKELVVSIPCKTPPKRRIPKIEIIIETDFDTSSRNINLRPSFEYELSKLSEPRDEFDFNFLSSLLSKKCEGNQIVLDELEHMKLNYDNVIEYYCSYYFIQSTLES